MAKIDKIQVGTTSYEINLPTTATPEISSLTITGNLNVEGTSNLSVISFINSTATNARIYIDDANMVFYNDTRYDFTFACDAGKLAICPEGTVEEVKFGYNYDRNRYNYTLSQLL